MVTPHPIELGGVQRALVVFGGRDESDARLDSVFALGLDDGEWRELRPPPPSLKKGARAARGPFDLPAVIRAAHEDTRAPYALARSGASAVVTDDNVMFIFGGFVVEGRLGFNVGELLALDLNAERVFLPGGFGTCPRERTSTPRCWTRRTACGSGGAASGTTPAGPPPTPARRRTSRDLSDLRRGRLARGGDEGLAAGAQRRLRASVIKDGVMYVIGGEDYHSKRFLQDVHALDLETLTWSRPRPPAPRAAGAFAPPPPAWRAWRTAPRSGLRRGARPRPRSRASSSPATTSS